MVSVQVVWWWWELHVYTTWIGGVGLGVGSCLVGEGEEVVGVVS